MRLSASQGTLSACDFEIDKFGCRCEGRTRLAAQDKVVHTSQSEVILRRYSGRAPHVLSLYEYCQELCGTNRVVVKVER
jgi:hypothetical protein